MPAPPITTKLRRSVVLLLYINTTQKTMTRQPKQLVPLIYAIESYQDVVQHLNTVLEGVMEDIDNGDDPTLTDSDIAELKSARNWADTAAKYAKAFEGGIKQ